MCDPSTGFQRATVRPYADLAGRERCLSRLSHGSSIQQEPQITGLAMLSQDVRLSLAVDLAIVGADIC
jgi:hypothetical protein